MALTLRSLLLGALLYPVTAWPQIAPSNANSLLKESIPQETSSHRGTVPDNIHLSHRRVTQYLFIVTTDGLRWQEVFAGADSALLFDPVSQALDTAGIIASRFWASEPAARRNKLMPFLWSIFARDGQLYGNRAHVNRMNVANRWAFSYPGYNELFTGCTDDWRIFSNRKITNPNRNLFGFLQRQQALRNKVVAFTSWSAFPYILNTWRTRIPVSSGRQNRRACAANGCSTEGPLDDPFTWTAALNHVRTEHPAITYISLNATDLLAHAGNYPACLEAVHQFDQYLKELWTYIQHDSVYRDRTTLLITTDHGRGGPTLRRWRKHNRHLPGSSEVWLGVIGPDTPGLGEVQAPMQLWQKQFAQTAAYLMGLEFRRSRRVAPAIEGVCRQKALEKLKK